MYDWLVVQIGSGGALGLAFGVLVLFFLLVVGGVSWEVRRLRRAYATKGREEFTHDKAHDKALVGAVSPQEDEMKEAEGMRRLTLCDRVTIDETRQLVLVRRDDVEHLILVGSAGDMVIEHNIPVEAETPALDAVSMLAITRAEETPFMMLGGGKTDNEEIEEKQDADSVKTEELKAPAGDGEGADLLANLDEIPPPDRPAPSDRGKLGSDKRPDEEDLVASLMQEAMNFANTKVDDAPTQIQASPAEAAKRPDLAVTSIFPEQGVLSSLNPVSAPGIFPQSMNRPEAKSHPPTSLPSLNFGLSQDTAQRPDQDCAPSDFMASKTNDIKKQMSEDPPIASYFAGIPKKTPPQQAQADASHVDVSLASQKQNPVANMAAVSVPPPPTAFGIDRILSLNPFVQAPPAPTEAVSPVENQDDISVPGQVEEPKDASDDTIAEKAHSANVSAPPPPPNFINSFLGFPLAQLTKTGAVTSANSAAQAHLQKTSHSSVIELKNQPLEKNSLTKI